MLKLNKYFKNTTRDKLKNYIEINEFLTSEINKSTKLLFIDENTKNFYNFILQYITNITIFSNNTYFISQNKQSFYTKLSMYQKNTHEIHEPNIKLNMNFIINMIVNYQNVRLYSKNKLNNYTFIIILDKSMYDNDFWLNRLLTLDYKYNIKVIMFSNYIPKSVYYITNNIDMTITSNFIINDCPMITGYNKLDNFNNNYLYKFINTIELRILLKNLRKNQLLCVINNCKKYKVHYFLTIKYTELNNDNSDNSDNSDIDTDEFIESLILEI